MADSKPKSKEVIPYEDLNVLEEGYVEKLDTDIRYSIAIDPEDKYNLSQSQKDFIEFYVQWKNIPLAAKMAGIDKDTAMQYYNTYGVKREIDRISLALYHRQFATKMLNLDEIGGYLTSFTILPSLIRLKNSCFVSSLYEGLLFSLHQNKYSSTVTPTSSNACLLIFILCTLVLFSLRN